MMNNYDPELDHTADVLTKVAERIAAASMLALAGEQDGANPLVVIAENAFMTGLAVGLLAPAWARVMHGDASRAYEALGQGPSKMPDVVGDITRDFPLGEEIA